MPAMMAERLGKPAIAASALFLGGVLLYLWTASPRSATDWQIGYLIANFSKARCERMLFVVY
jgi:hypothetical protein